MNSYNKMNIDQKKKIRNKSILALSYTVGGTILPFLIASILLRTFSKLNIAMVFLFIDKGDFLLYGVALMAGAYYLFNEKDNKDFINNQQNSGLLNAISHLLIPFIILASVVYAGIYMKESIIPPSISEIVLDIGFIRWFSIITLCCSVYASYKALWIQNVRMLPELDVKEERNSELNDLANKIGVTNSEEVKND